MAEARGGRQNADQQNALSKALLGGPAAVGKEVILWGLEKVCQSVLSGEENKTMGKGDGAKTCSQSGNQGTKNPAQASTSKKKSKGNVNGTSEAKKAPVQVQAPPKVKKEPVQSQGQPKAQKQPVQSQPHGQGKVKNSNPNPSTSTIKAGKNTTTPTPSTSKAGNKGSNNSKVTISAGPASNTGRSPLTNQGQNGVPKKLTNPVVQQSVSRGPPAPPLRQISRTSDTSTNSSGSSSSRNSTPNPGSRPAIQKSISADNNPAGDPIIIAIDATKGHAAGLLFRPKTNKILIYVFNWAPIFTFEAGKEKPDVVNAYLSLEIFGSHIRQYRRDHGYPSVNVKTLKNFCLEDFGSNGSMRKSLFQKVDEKLQGYKGQWIKTTPNDVHSKIASQLARNQPRSGLGLSGIDEEIDITNSHYGVLHSVGIVIPEQLKAA